jgi:hypothetical protein
VLRHFIPKARLQWDYALGLMRGMGESSTLIALYLFALNGPPFDVYPAWKRTWLFQILKTLRHLVRVILFHPDACFRQPEGSLSVLEYEKLKSQLAALWALRGRYKKVQEDIRQSAWAKGQSRPTG